MALATPVFGRWSCSLRIEVNNLTCIIGFTDRENNISWIGGDSLGSDGYIKATEMPSKVFRNETFTNVLIGGTTTFRHLDLLKYSESLFDEIDWYKKANIDHKYMVTKFIPKVIELFKDGIIGEPETKRGGNFIVATPGKIFEVQPDYSVLEPELGICSVGCGAEQYCCGVQRPFRILCTDGSDEIVIR